MTSALVAASLVLCSVAAAAPATWSPSVDGVRARLVVTPATDAQRRPQLAIALELENTSDVANPLPISWGAYGDMVRFELEDEQGRVLPRLALPGNELSPAPVTLQLPVASTLHVQLTGNAIEYVPNGKALLRPLVFPGWDLPAKPGKLYLRATFTPATPATTTDRRALAHPLVLPRVQLP